MKKPEPPKRIQRKRTAGWKMPPNTVCVTRPSRWGNPFYVAKKPKPGDPGFHCLTAAEAVRNYERLIAEPVTRHFIRKALRGNNLACFCKLSEPCHADILLKIANE